MRSGDPLTQLVQFTSGFPDGDVTWILRDEIGGTITSGTVTPAAGDLSVVINISGVSNTLGVGELYTDRELSWTYAVGGVQYHSHRRYRVETFLAFGVSPDGVRNKLGIEAHELDDEEIDLVLAYAVFQRTVTAPVLAAVTDPLSKLLICDAIEALAALRKIKTLQVKIAQKEVSGASQFQRASIKWDVLEGQLNEMIAAGYSAIIADFDGASTFGSSFLVVTRTPDIITGV